MAQFVTEYVKDKDGRIRKKEPKQPAEQKPKEKEDKEKKHV